MTDTHKQWKGPSRAPSPEEMADRYAVGQLAQIYALGMDMGDFKLVKSAFAQDAVGMGKNGPEPIEEYLAGVFRVAESFDETQHVISNQYITIHGNEAVMWSYGVVHHKVAKNADRDEIIAGVQYRDRCKKNVDGWVITSRSVAPVWLDIARPR